MTAPTPSDALFASPTVEWRPIQRNYRWIRRVNSLWYLLPFGIAAGVLAFTLQWWWLVALVAGVGVVLTGVRCALATRYWSSWGYAELADDLWITHGVMFRHLTVVPYGRMQVVEISSGPLERALGLCTVTLVTASAETDATIPGLDPDEAAKLRDRLTQRGDARASGL